MTKQYHLDGTQRLGVLYAVQSKTRHSFASSLVTICAHALQNATACMMTPECYQPALNEHLLLLKDEAAVQTWLRDKPHSLDAVVVFPQAAAAAADKAASGAAREDIQLMSQAPRLFSSSSGQSSSGHSSSRAASQGPKQLVGCGAPGPPDGDGLLLEYVIRMNSSDVPPTQLLRDLFDVSPGIMPLPGNLLW
jgi:hypothetical protein